MDEKRIPVPRLKGAERTRIAKAMVKDYNRGLTLRQVAEKHSRSVGGTRTLLLEGGVAWRTGYEARRPSTGRKA